MYQKHINSVGEPKITLSITLTQSAGAVEYTDSFSKEG